MDDQRKVALFDMDGTLVDYDRGIINMLETLRSPDEPPIDNIHDGGLPELAHVIPPWLKARMELIEQVPGWWKNLERFYLGFDVLQIAQEIGFDIHILTKGPSNPLKSVAWKEKFEWVREHIPSASIIITEDKSLVYGRVLVDDFPPYVDAWLKWRRNGIAIMPHAKYNEAYSHPNLTKYDGSLASMDEVRTQLEWAFDRIGNYHE